MSEATYDYLMATAEAFREQRGLTGHRKAHCQAAIVEVFATLECLLSSLPSRRRTKAGMAEVAQDYLIRRIARLSQSARPLHRVDAQLYAFLRTDHEFLPRVMHAAKAAALSK